MRTHHAWIIIRNGDDMRLVKKLPGLYPNEVAIEVTITAPDPPRIVARIAIDLPEPPPAFADATVIEYTPDDEATP